MSVAHIVLSLLILRHPQDFPTQKSFSSRYNSGKEAFDVMYSITLIFS